VVMAVVALVGFSVVAAWAGPAEETLAKWADELMYQNPDLLPEGITPEVNMGYYFDLMSNSPGWDSFLVVTNWSLNTRIQFITGFVPTGGTPSNIVYREHYVDPNQVKYLNKVSLGFTSFGTTNWFGIGIAIDPPDYISCGVLLYASEYGLTWIPGDGPYSF